MLVLNLGIFADKPKWNEKKKPDNFIFCCKHGCKVKFRLLLTTTRVNQKKSRRGKEFLHHCCCKKEVFIALFVTNKTTLPNIRLHLHSIPLKWVTSKHTLELYTHYEV